MAARTRRGFDRLAIAIGLTCAALVAIVAGVDFLYPDSFCRKYFMEQWETWSACVNTIGLLRGGVVVVLFVAVPFALFRLVNWVWDGFRKSGEES